MRFVALFAFVLVGCAMESPLIDTQNERAGFVITKSPIQISYRGDITPESRAFTLEILKEIKDVPFKSYTFQENHNVRLNSIDGKSDKVNITLVESTTAQKPTPKE